MGRSYSSDIYYVPETTCPAGHFLRYTRNKACAECHRGHNRREAAKRAARYVPPPHFRSDYATNPTQFDGPFDNCVCIPLTKGYHALIDAEDFHLTEGYYFFSYNSDRRFYAVTKIDDKHAPLHRLVNKTPDGLHTDHINGNTLDNRRSNLRSCDCSTNQLNTGSRGGSSKYKNVTWREKQKKWSVTVRANKKKVYIGLFADEEEAARAADAANIKNHGEFVRLNLPNEYIAN